MNSAESLIFPRDKYYDNLNWLLVSIKLCLHVYKCTIGAASSYVATGPCSDLCEMQVNNFLPCHAPDSRSWYFEQDQNMVRQFAVAVADKCQWV